MRRTRTEDLLAAAFVAALAFTTAIASPGSILETNT
jgi:hypothetical protein